MIQRLLDSLKKIIKDTNRIYILTLVVFFCIVFFVPERKLFFVITVVFISTIVYIFKNFNVGLFLGYLAIHMFPIGQLYRVVFLTEQQLFYIERYSLGKAGYFVLSPSYIIGFIILIVVAVKLLFAMNSRRIFSAELYLLFGLVMLKIVSGIFAQFAPIYSMASAFEIVFIVAWGYLGIFLQNEIDNTANNIFVTISLLQIFQAGVVVIQWFSQKPIGILLEQSRIGVLPEISVDLFRPSGFFSHPNMMAASSMCFFFIFLFALTRKKIKIIMIIGLLSSVLIILLSQSRAAYLGTLLGSLPIIILVIKKHKDIILSFLRKEISLIITLLIVSLLSVSIYIVAGRAVNTIYYSLGSGGGFDVRALLQEEAIRLILKNPLVGLGYGVFVPVAYEQSLTGVLDWFPEPVHNGFLLVASESGLIALFFLLFVIVKILLKALKIISWEKECLVGYSISIVVFMMFHPADLVVSVGTMIVICLLNINRARRHLLVS